MQDLDLEIITLDNALILEQRNENILKYGLVKIPTPACIVLYNGMEKRPEVEILKLSNAFENQEVEPCLELFVKVLNINNGMNENVLNGCKTKSETLQRQYTKQLTIVLTQTICARF